jgi:hypothetical protein
MAMKHSDAVELLAQDHHLYRSKMTVEVKTSTSLFTKVIDLFTLPYVKSITVDPPSSS